jgi:hypothetical protein
MHMHVGPAVTARDQSPGRQPPSARLRREVIDTANRKRSKPEREGVNAGQANRACSQKALRAYHLHRVTSKFKTTISPESARRLARLLALGSDKETTSDE